jgi:hypothetical protein
MTFYQDDARIICTARTMDAINEAVALGSQIVLKACDPSPPFETTVSIFRHKKLGTYRYDLDPREAYRNPESYHQWEHILALDYYPPQFKNAFAAYLVPSDIAYGERVWLDDLIEDLLGAQSGQGLGRYRLRQAYARWNGEDFDIEYSEDDVDLVIG